MHVAAPGARQKRLSRLVTSQVEGALRLTLISNDDMTGSASHRTPPYYTAVTSRQCWAQAGAEMDGPEIEL
jgi:hypothetical protein